MSTWQLVKVPAIISLAISLLRLIGELAGWSETFFSTAAGGGFSPVGISWWILIFGFWFGWKLAKAGDAPEVPGRVMITYLVAIVLTGLVGFLFASPEEGKVVPSTSGYMIFLATGWICSLVTLLSWSRLTRTLLLYGLLARLPVIAIALLSMAFGWQTHYVAPPEEMTEVSTGELLMFSCLPQIGFWIPATVLVGGLFGGLGALLGRRGG